MVADLVDRVGILVVFRRFHGMGVASSPTLRSDSHSRINAFVRRSTYVHLCLFLEDVRREFI
jgi:hypothetical protein